MCLITFFLIINSRTTSTVQAATDDGKFYPGVYSDAEKEMLDKVIKQGGTFGSLYNQKGELAKEYFNAVPELKGKGINAHGTVGSVLIAKAYVTKKYIEKSDSTHRVEMIVWTEENFDGDLCQAARVTVILASKGDAKKK